MKLKLFLCLLTCLTLLMIGCNSEKNDQNGFQQDMLGVKFHQNDEWGLNDEEVPQYSAVSQITTQISVSISDSDAEKLDALLQDRSRWHPGCLKISCRYTLQTNGARLYYSDEYGYIQDWEKDLHLCLTRDEALWLNTILHGEDHTPIHQEKSFWFGIGATVVAVSCMIVTAVIFSKKSSHRSA
jgi:hypothetical protein